MYAEIAVSLGLSIISLIIGTTTERLKKSSKIASALILCSLSLIQGAAFKYFKSTRLKIISLSSLLILSNFIGRNLQMIGLTGGIACGKSSVISIIKENHPKIAVIDCDLIAREVVRPGRRAYKSIMREFGKEYIQYDGHINREKLGELIFDNPKARRALNRIMQPEIFWEIIKKVVKFRLSGIRIVICDAPLLFESKVMAYLCCPVITVFIEDHEIWIRRLCKRDLISASEARGKIGCQMSIEEKVEQSDISINNSGSLYQLEGEVEKVMRELGIK